MSNEFSNGNGNSSKTSESNANQIGGPPPPPEKQNNNEMSSINSNANPSGGPPPPETKAETTTVCHSKRTAQSECVDVSTQAGRAHLGQIPIQVQDPRLGVPRYMNIRTHRARARGPSSHRWSPQQNGCAVGLSWHTADHRPRLDHLPATPTQHRAKLHSSEIVMARCLNNCSHDP